MSFEQIVGNDKIKAFFEKAIEENHILHSYLFVGIEGIGKALFARELSRKILCFQQEETENCASCIAFQSGNHPDFYEIKPENKTIKIEQIRNIQQEISQKPVTSNRKVYVIIDSDAMTKEAQNCLLKTLEEPPEYATIILITSNEAKLLNTIKSRCMKVSFEPISIEQIKQYAMEKLHIDIPEQLIEASQGSIGRAIELEKQKETYAQIDELLKKIETQDLITIFHQAEVFYKEKETIQELLEYINILLYNTKEQKKLCCIPYVEETKKRILANSNYDMCIDFLLMKMWEKVNAK